MRIIKRLQLPKKPPQTFWKVGDKFRFSVCGASYTGRIVEQFVDDPDVFRTMLRCGDGNEFVFGASVLDLTKWNAEKMV